MTMLVVADFTPQRKVLSSLTLNEGFRALVAGDGAEALEICKFAIGQGTESEAHFLLMVNRTERRYEKVASNPGG